MKARLKKLVEWGKRVAIPKVARAWAHRQEWAQPVKRFLWLILCWLSCALLCLIVVWLATWSISPEGLRFWSGPGEDITVTPSEVLRNLGLTALGVIGLPLAIWRSLVAERNARVAERSHQNERYQTAAKMLGDSILAVRLGGIYALDRLARESPKEYHITAMELFCAFVRNPPHEEADTAAEAMESTPEGTDKPGKKAQEEPIPLRQDIQEIVERIRTRSKTGIEIEDAKFRLNLLEANLGKAKLFRANLSDAILSRTNLSGALLTIANLYRAYLTKANLSGTFLTGANLKEALP